MREIRLLPLSAMLLLCLFLTISAGNAGAQYGWSRISGDHTVSYLALGATSIGPYTEFGTISEDSGVRPKHCASIGLYAIGQPYHSRKSDILWGLNVQGGFVQSSARFKTALKFGAGFITSWKTIIIPTTLSLPLSCSVVTNTRAFMGVNFGLRGFININTMDTFGGGALLVTLPPDFQLPSFPGRF